MDQATRQTILMLSSESREVRHYAYQVLVNVGMPAVRQLVRALDNDNFQIRSHAAEVLRELGRAETLPRLVLADARLSPHKRIKTLEALRRIDYHSGGISLRYPLPELPLYCRQQLAYPDPAVREGAQEVLWELDHDSLLRAGQRNEAAEAEELLRGAEGRASQTAPETLLRAAESVVDTPEKKAGTLARLFRRKLR